MAYKTCRSIYICSKCKTCGALSEVWFLAPFPYHDNDKTYKASRRRTRRTAARKSNTNISSFHWSRFSEISKHKQEQTLDKCSLLTNSVYDGLDLKHEIIAVSNQNLGDTILLYSNNYNNTTNKDDNNSLVGLAVCHCGAGSEAGSGVCYIKFGIVLSDDYSEENFKNLLNATSSLAKDRQLSRIVAGVNTERNEAYRYMVEYGFRAEMQGIAMHRPNESGYNRSDVYLIDDWR